MFRAQADVLQDGRTTAAICIELNFRPRIVGMAGVFGLDAYEMIVAVRDAERAAIARMIRHARCDDIISAIAPESQLRERAAQIGPAFDEHTQGRHVAFVFTRARSVVTQHAERLTKLTPAALLPAAHERDFEPSGTQYLRQPQE
jgi:hypothetical protein